MTSFIASSALMSSSILGSSDSSSLWSRALPEHCTPTTAFLHHLSAYTHTCIPTPLAFLSVLLGCLSIVSWLFAQLPQIVKNFRLRSTSGLSIFFLVEWCLGDVSNLVGGILTHQATWQMIIATYYCFVDFMLVGQWIWYEQLKHGRHLRRMWLTKYQRQFDRDHGAMQQLPESSEHGGTRATDHFTSTESAEVKRPGTSAGLAQPADAQLFHTPRYSSSPRKQASLAPPQPKSIRRAQANANPLPSPSPRTILFISMLVCLCSTGLASPTSIDGRGSRVPLAPRSTTDLTADRLTSETVGMVISWLSTCLYLGSRLPQIIKNARLRSTAGLSPLLFLAAFLGNLFYSTSMLTNPLLYASSTPPYGAHGWSNSPDTIHRKDWIMNALPFFLGAAGVLVMDAGVGLQFWLFRVNSSALADEVIVVVDEDEQRHDARKDSSDGTADGTTRSEPLHMHGRHWRRVSGWMRGWSPAVAGSWASGFGTPVGDAQEGGALRFGIEDDNGRLPSGAAGAGGERTRLLGAPRGEQEGDERRGYGALP